ncbi:hypothetical protein BU23DRAFT_652348 [Bimuria novae-zelandiae CBS 107.79]|uniref:Mid2 domain-containing protein n=1 Tax=Bimuria novae-zelandiae CBS 107.79 TaxID=1447943 RepID=A0A6A5V8L0_9PLEO|nr:hypothetical protein BU23DRAFT_652348 [Bimuria novae-zelandiae CBS 107.79]
MFDFARYALLFLLVCICGSLGSDIVSFTDDECRKSFNSLDTINGYPDGMCRPLKITGKLETFQIAKLDPGCAVTLYGPNDDTGLSCSSPVKIVGELATCYNSSWIYYSIDGCLPPSKSSVALPSATPSPSPSSSLSSSASTMASSSSSSSSTTSTTLASALETLTTMPLPSQSTSHTGAIIGAIVGSVAVCALVIGLLLLWLHRRKSATRKPPPSPPTPPSYELSQERALIEAARGSMVAPRTVAVKEVWAHEAAVEMGRNSYAPPVELPDNSWNGEGEKGEKDGSAFIRVHMTR